MDQNQAEEIRRAADKFAEAVQQYYETTMLLLQSQERVQENLVWYSRAFSAFAPGISSQRQARRPLLFNYIGAGGLDEEDAVKIAVDVKHRTELQGEQPAEAEAPSPDEVRKRREARRQQES